MLGPLALKLLPLLAGIGFLWILLSANPRQRRALAGAWLLPGLGHLILGKKDRALFFALALLPMFLTGLVLGNFATVSPLDRHPIWGMAQVPGGLMTIVTALLTKNATVAAADVYYSTAQLYTGAACLLNILAMCDVYDLAKSSNAAPLAGPKA
jgi:hypothetical protein